MPTILIAEDADSREMMQILREAKGYQVVSAEDGVRAMELAIQTRPDALLPDLSLPKVNGFSVTRSLRLHPAFKRKLTVVISGHDPTRYRPEALDAGCDEYLLKPIDFDRLPQLLERFFSRQQSVATRSA